MDAGDRRQAVEEDEAIERELRINDRIRRSPVRVIGDEGEQLGVIPVEEALRSAKEAGLDLVEVDPNSSPPVCKIMDFGKFRYRQKKKQHQSTHKQHTAQIKGVRLFPKTEQHDLEHKAKHASQFLEAGDKVLVFMRFFGRWMAHVDIGADVMRKFAALLDDVAKIEQEPRMDGRRMSMMLTPRPASDRKAIKKPKEPTEKPDAESQNP